MSLATPQRTISLSIVGNDDKANVFYSYLSPVTGLSFINAPQCDLEVNQPINTLFVLDYASSLSGWKIVKTSPYGASKPLEQIPGALHQSIMTHNPYDVPGEVYRFYIHYHNSITGQNLAVDPQEGNIPPE